MNAETLYSLNKNHFTIPDVDIRNQRGGIAEIAEVEQDQYTLDRYVDFCSAINCDDKLCEVVCDRVCDLFCERVCDEWCDGVCERICDQICEEWGT